MKKFTYENGLAELNEIIEKIEDGELTLEETIKAYEKGNQLVKKPLPSEPKFPRRCPIQAFSCASSEVL